MPKNLLDSISENHETPLSVQFNSARRSLSEADYGISDGSEDVKRGQAEYKLRLTFMPPSEEYIRVTPDDALIVTVPLLRDGKLMRLVTSEVFDALEDLYRRRYVVALCVTATGRELAWYSEKTGDNGETDRLAIMRRCREEWCQVFRDGWQWRCSPAKKNENGENALGVPKFTGRTRQAFVEELFGTNPIWTTDDRAIQKLWGLAT